MAVVMVVIMVMRTMIVNMTVFNSGSEILEHQLDKKSGQYKCADHLDVIVLYVKFGKDVRYRNGEKIRACEYEQQFIVCRSEEHTSELQSRENLVCRLLLEKK